MTKKKGKRKLTPAEKREKKRRREEYETVFINGKQKQVKRPQTIDGLDVDEFIRRNADPIWLHQNGMWEYLDEKEDTHNKDRANQRNQKLDEDGMIPF
jgi:16S rRNA U516 pseudouridylate synthase RsuA-like enzyme